MGGNHCIAFFTGWPWRSSDRMNSKQSTQYQGHTKSSKTIQCSVTWIPLWLSQAQVFYKDCRFISLNVWVNKVMEATCQPPGLTGQGPDTGSFSHKQLSQNLGPGEGCRQTLSLKKCCLLGTISSDASKFSIIFFSTLHFPYSYLIPSKNGHNPFQLDYLTGFGW